MAIISGRYGQVLWDPTGGATAVEVLSLNAWTANFSTEFEDVTTFGSVNREYLPGLKNAEGTLAGFFNSAELALFEAAEQDTPGLLKLLPSSTEAAVYWSGPAYMDASIDASLAAPKISGTWKAAGPFVLNGGVMSAMAQDAREKRLEAQRRDQESRGRRDEADDRPRKTAR
jgi:hypothetical protein